MVFFFNIKVHLNPLKENKSVLEAGCGRKEY